MRKSLNRFTGLADNVIFYLQDWADGIVCASIPWWLLLRYRSCPRTCPNRHKSLVFFPAREVLKFSWPYYRIDVLYFVAVWLRKSRRNKAFSVIIFTANEYKTVQHPTTGAIEIHDWCESIYIYILLERAKVDTGLPAQGLSAVKRYEWSDEVTHSGCINYIVHIRHNTNRTN